MIYLLSGPINSGKTSWILKDFQQFPDADGFACRKVWEAGQHIGYDLQHLQTGFACPFIRTPDHHPTGWEEAAQLNDRFSFSAAGFLFARHITLNAILNNVKRFYLDEAGHLELCGQGFNHIMQALLGAQIDLVLVVRESLVEQMAEAYKISTYTLIRDR